MQLVVIDQRAFVAFAPGRMKGGSRRIIGNSSWQMHDELMVK
jgi:hypothetical protein